MLLFGLLALTKAFAPMVVSLLTWEVFFIGLAHRGRFHSNPPVRTSDVYTDVILCKREHESMQLLQVLKKDPQGYPEEIVVSFFDFCSSIHYSSGKDADVKHIKSKMGLSRAVLHTYCTQSDKGLGIAWHETCRQGQILAIETSFLKGHFLTSQLLLLVIATYGT